MSYDKHIYTCRKVITPTPTHSHNTHSLTHLSSPAMPCMMRLSLVSVPVLSKQHTSDHLPSKGDAERLSAVDAQLGECYEGGVDGQGELDGQLWRDHGGQDQGALQEELVAVALLVHRAWWGRAAV